MTKNIKNASFVLLCLIVVFCIFFGGFFLGKNNTQNVLSTTDKEQFMDYNKNVDFEPFWEVWNLLDQKYQAASSTMIVSDQDRVWGAISGMVDSLGDPYTVFLPPEENEEFEMSIKGEFAGVGMEVGKKDDILTVISPLKNTPAEKAGIKSGDKIIEIDGLSALSMSINEAVDLIRGEAGTEVELTLAREGVDDLIKLKIIRQKINIPTIDTEIINDVFVISLYNFSENSSEEFSNALREFLLSKKNKMILDLRGNPGGFLESAVEITSWFLPAGKLILTEDFFDEEDKKFRSKGYNIFNKDFKMVILVNEGSASASEIVAGALQEYGIAKLVGTNTFGKGTVQELIPVTEKTTKTSLKVTIAKWLTPKGNSISDGGLTPDYIIDKVPENITTELEDYQLEKALEIVNY